MKKTNAKAIVKWINKDRIFSLYKLTKFTEFEKWYVKNYARLPDIALIDELRPQVYKADCELRVKQGALNHEKHLIETFEKALKAWISLKEEQ